MWNNKKENAMSKKGGGNDGSVGPIIREKRKEIRKQ